jgi:hypothetical protein
MKTKTKIRRSIKIIPSLTDFGLGIPQGVKIRQRKKKMKDEKRRLLDNEERFESACKWLKELDKTQAINTRYTSYYIKHIAERRIGGHLSNGALIAAAIYLGFDYKVASGHANVFFNMDHDQIQQKYQESLLYDKYRNEEVIEMA